MKKKISIIAVICIVCVGLVLAAGYMLRIRGSVHVKSQSDFAIDNTLYYVQKDPQWADEKLGNSSFTMAGSGCLTTCIASELQMQHIAVPEIQKMMGLDNGTALTPGILNEYFSKQGVYDSEGNIQWSAVEKALGVAIVKPQKGQLRNDGIDKLLEQGIYPIAFVRVNGVGNFHFVLICGSKDGDYLCMDPMNEAKTPVPLSQFGNRIFAARYID